MCGFAGMVDVKTQRTRDERLSILHTMADAIVHRGPDDSGYWIDPAGPASLAFRRLAILDLTPQGRQPMLSADGRYVLMFNGEIYNHLELRRELESSVAFRGRSDTEVMLAAFGRWGLEGALPRFVGMFAAALWDIQRRTLHLVRDRFGKKPLYYGWQKGALIFGSEVKALRAHPDFDASIDTEAVRDYLRFSCVPGERSIYAGVSKVRPGTISSFEFGSRVRAETRTYWSLESTVRRGRKAPFTGTHGEAVSILEGLLRDAVKIRMVADVPLGAFLSGGIDSTSIVALMQSESSQRVKTFTIGFSELNYNESEHASAIATHLGTAHEELQLNPSDVLDVIPSIPAIYDEPFADSSQIPTFLVSRMARRHVTVALSGDGGDELFGGYHRHFLARSLSNVLRVVPPLHRRVAAGVVMSLSPRTWDQILNPLNRLVPRRYRRQLSGERLHKLASVLKVRSHDDLHAALVSCWRDPDDVMNVEIDGPCRTDETDSVLDCLGPAERFMYLDTVGYLRDDILVKIDRAAMAVSLETRAPFLDHRVAEFAWTLPLSAKIRGWQGKRILRDILDRYVPRALVDRPKTGFGIPIGQWLRGALRPWAEEMLDERRLRADGLLRPEPIRQAWSEHLNGGRDHESRLWNVLMLQAWLHDQRSRTAERSMRARLVVPATGSG